MGQPSRLPDCCPPPSPAEDHACPVYAPVIACDSEQATALNGARLPTDMSLPELWRASRVGNPPSASELRVKSTPAPASLPPGSHRPLTLRNATIACRIVRATSLDLCRLLWTLNRTRTAAFVLLTLVRGLLPAFRGYSQARILDEIQSLIASGEFPSHRLGYLVLTEGGRMLAENVFYNIANHNEDIVASSMRYTIEHKQMEQRLRLDLPSLSDPAIRDLLHESDLFVRSFMGMGGFGLFSPFDFVRLLSTFSELLSQLFVLLSTSKSSSHLLVIALLIFPTIISFLASWFPSFSQPSECLYSPEEAKAAETQERMRSLAHSESYKSEVALFGLGPWILQSWSSARKLILGLERPSSSRSTISELLIPGNSSEILLVIQNLPFLLYSSSASLGSLALYRNSVQSLLYTSRTIFTTFQLAFQSIFFMGAFFAAMQIKPRLSPHPDKCVKYESLPNGMRIEARNISFVYPDNNQPTLRNVSFTLEAGETLAIVGYNGSGKSTLANVLLRIFDFAEGELLINGVDIRRLDPEDYHAHITTLFQTFSKFNASMRENVGIGDINKEFKDCAIYKAASEAGAKGLVQSLPRGLDTQLECVGNDFPPPYTPGTSYASELNSRHGLSGGEWQKVAISRALMRASTADLLLFDEPTSHLDAHAQNNIFKTIDSLCRDAVSGDKIKTCILITHQLSIAKRADKIAMFENGTITEYGTHQELLARPGSHYAALYQATC